MRLDLLLVQKKLASSRTQAQDFIKNGYVYLVENQKNIQILKPSTDILEPDYENILVQNNQLQKYVSRAGLKLEAALNYLNLDVAEKNILDIGQSTGGFTDCLLQRQAHCVVGIDVGQGQLHESLKNHKKVTYFESLHVNALQKNPEFLKTVPEKGFDLIVTDVSFISLTKVMLYLKDYLKVGGDFLFLVKPQFEAGPDALDNKGLVNDEKSYSVVQNNITSEATKVFGQVQDYFKSELLGKDGNQEFFIYGQNTN